MGTMEVKERAVAAMHSLAMQDKGKGRDPGSAVNLLASTPSGLQALVSLIESGNTSTQGHAAATLGTVARGHTEVQIRVVQFGGARALGSMLRGGAGGATHEQAAAALAAISSPAENTSAILKENTIAPLIGLLRNGTSAAQVHASEAISNLAVGREGQDAVQRVGGVRSLLGLLSTGKAQEHAARALASLAHDNYSIQHEICAAGGIAMLLALLSTINTEVQVGMPLCVAHVRRTSRVQRACACVGAACTCVVCARVCCARARASTRT